MEVQVLSAALNDTKGSDTLGIFLFAAAPLLKASRLVSSYLF
ncbi:hypothetical protein [Bacillus velezensis]|nr:hypothetical protein [Bacillus velezensis]MEC1940023.1 hypothetical protein [Bacillus velezensis]